MPVRLAFSPSEVIDFRPISFHAIHHDRLHERFKYFYLAIWMSV